MHLRKIMIAALMIALSCGLLSAQQESEGAQNNQEGQEQPATEEPVRGGVTYSPLPDSSGRLRDPFKSPFEIEQEEREEREQNQPGLPDAEQRLPYNIDELAVKGIYLEPQTGYWAIFEVGGEYDWFQIGAKFRDGDLVNITDRAVFFKHYVSEDATQVREVIKELHRGEE